MPYSIFAVTINQSTLSFDINLFNASYRVWTEVLNSENWWNSVYRWADYWRNSSVMRRCLKNWDWEFRAPGLVTADEWQPKHIITVVLFVCCCVFDVAVQCFAVKKKHLLLKLQHSSVYVDLFSSVL